MTSIKVIEILEVRVTVRQNYSRREKRGRVVRMQLHFKLRGLQMSQTLMPETPCRGEDGGGMRLERGLKKNDAKSQCRGGRFIFI